MIKKRRVNKFFLLREKVSFFLNMIKVLPQVSFDILVEWRTQLKNINRTFFGYSFKRWDIKSKANKRGATLISKKVLTF